MLNTPKSPLKVIQLSSSHKGGAGIAARRLNLALNKAGVDSVFICISKNDYIPGEFESVIKRQNFYRLSSWVSTLISMFLSDISFFSLFSAPAISTKKLIALAKQPNVVLHIHNWFNLLSQKQISRLIEADLPIVFTLHDQRLLTGGCHTSLSCLQFKSGCRQCPMVPRLIQRFPAKNLSRMAQVFFAAGKEVQIVSPSRFNINEASISRTLNTNNLHYASNPISELDEFKLKKSLSMHSKKMLVIGIASMDPFDLLKGGALVREIVDSNQSHSDLYNLVFLRDYQKEDAALFWEDIDALLVPSLSDNSPNVIHEAKLTGTPVIASRVGGITELLNPKIDVGIELAHLNFQGFLRALQTLRNFEINSADLEENRSSHLRALEFSLTKITEVYHQALNPRN
jgi:glycosyltransferase involved in cell wall biosynthesis